MVFVDQNVAKAYNPSPKQPNSPARQAVRNRFRQVASFWNALDTSHNLAWATAAEGRYGWNLYQSLASVWLNAHNGLETPSARPPTGEYAGAR